MIQIGHLEIYINYIKKKRKKKKVYWKDFDIIKCYEGCTIVSIGPVGITWLKGRCR